MLISDSDDNHLLLLASNLSNGLILDKSGSCITIGDNLVCSRSITGALISNVDLSGNLVYNSDNKNIVGPLPCNNDIGSPDSLVATTSIPSTTWQQANSCLFLGEPGIVRFNYASSIQLSSPSQHVMPDPGSPWILDAFYGILNILPSRWNHDYRPRWVNLARIAKQIAQSLIKQISRYAWRIFRIQCLNYVIDREIELASEKKAIFGRTESESFHKRAKSFSKMLVIIFASKLVGNVRTKFISSFSSTLA